MTTNKEGAPEGQRANPLQALDNLLHCGICFDYFNIAMIIPQCSHNYCSLCIRKFLSYKTQCPTCFVTVTEPDLRNNRRLDDLVQAFLATRKNLPQHTGSPPSSSQNPSKDKVASTRSEGFSTKKNKQEGTSMEKFLVRKSERSKRTLESSTEESLDTSLPAELISAKKIKQEAEDSVTEYSASQEPSTSVPKVSIKLECPVCGVGIPEQYINKHLDSCLTRDEKKESLRSSGQKRRPVAKVVYNLLSERDLRKRLKEVGLSTHGTKQQMIRRHQEFVQMYNAQCDSLNPKSAAEIVKEIETSEKVRASLEAKKETVMTFKKEQSEEEIDEIHQQYRNKHKSEFQQLVEQVKGRWKAGKKAKEEPVAENIPDDQDTKDTAIDEEVTEITENGESLEDCFQRTANTSAVRSDSPIFPLSPDSRISSSSDILRDIEEAAVPQESKSALNHSEPKNRKRKTTSGKEEAATRYPRTPRSKRQRK